MELKTVFSSDDNSEIEFIRNILEEEGIPTIVTNQYTQNLFSGIKMFSGHDPIAGSMEIQVNILYFDEAVNILKDHEINDSSELEQEKLENSSTTLDNIEENQEEIITNNNIIQRRIYFMYICIILSFLIIPYFISIYLFFKLRKDRKIISYMSLTLSTIIFIFSSIMILFYN